MKVKEIFYSLQGEGANTGKAAIFIRLSWCNLRCWFCDTEFDDGNNMTVQEIYDTIKNYPSRFIIWTGGEPTLQLREDTVAFFKAKGYFQAIETNGTRSVPHGIDYITCSPKDEAMAVLRDNFPNGVNEFRFPITVDSVLPPAIEELPTADNYLVSPVFVGEDAMVMEEKSLRRCIQFVLDNPRWRLSLQTHKLINIE